MARVYINGVCAWDDETDEAGEGWQKLVDDINKNKDIVVAGRFEIMDFHHTIIRLNIVKEEVKK